MKKTIPFFFFIFNLGLIIAQNTDHIIHKFSAKEYPLNNPEIKFLEKTSDNKQVVVREATRQNTYSQKPRYYIEVYDQDFILLRETKFRHKMFSEILIKNDSIFLLHPKKEYNNNNEANNLKSIKIMAYASPIKRLKFQEVNFYNIDPNEEFNSHFFKNSNSLTTKIIKSKNSKCLSFLFETPIKEKITSKGPLFLFSKSITKTKSKKTYSQAYKAVTYKEGKLLYSQNFILNHFVSSSISKKLSINENDGSIYFIEQEMAEKRPLFDFKLYTLVTHNLVKINDNQLYRMNMSNYERINFLTAYNIAFYKNKVSLVGYYASDIKRQNCLGIFKFDLDNNLSFNNKNLMPFSEDFINDRIHVLKQTNKKIQNALQFKPLAFRDVFFNKKGDCFIIAGEGFRNFPNSNAPSYKSTTSTFSNIAKINKENELVWSRSIYTGSKYQKSATIPTSILAGENLFLIYNQPEKIMAKQINPSLNIFNGKKNRCFIASINSEGNVNYTPLTLRKAKNTKLTSTAITNNGSIYLDSKFEYYRMINKIKFKK